MKVKTKIVIPAGFNRVSGDQGLGNQDIGISATDPGFVLKGYVYRIVCRYRVAVKL